MCFPHYDTYFLSLPIVKLVSDVCSFPFVSYADARVETAVGSCGGGLEGGDGVGCWTGGKEE